MARTAVDESDWAKSTGDPSPGSPKRAVRTLTQIGKDRQQNALEPARPLRPTHAAEHAYFNSCRFASRAVRIAAGSSARDSRRGQQTL